MTNLSGISLICFAGDCVGGSPITIGAPLMAANSANAVALRSLTLKLIASMIGSPSDSPVSLRLRQRRQEKGPTHTVDQNRSDGPAYGEGALRLFSCRSKYTSAALNIIIHDE